MARIAILMLTVLPALVYEGAPSVIPRISSLARITDKALRIERAIPGRDSYTYFLRPRKNGDHSARDFSMAALQLAEPEGLIVADNTTGNPIVYLQQVQQQYTRVYLSKRADLQADREVPASLATVDRWLALGRWVFIVSPVRERELVEQLEAQGRFNLVFRDPLYEVLAKHRPTD